MPVYEKKDKFKINKNDFNKEISEMLKKELRIATEPVGVQFYYTKEEFEQSEFENSRYKMAYCVYVKKALEDKIRLKTTTDSHYCDGATTALGMEEPTQEIRSGRTYFSYGLYETKGIAQKVWKEVPAFWDNNIRLYGIGIAPLKDYTSEPDIVIIISDALSMMRLIQSTLYKEGKRVKLDVSSMQGICSEVTATPYLTGDINISFLCPSTRKLCKWENNDLAAGIPYNKLTSIIDGAKKVNLVK